MGPLSRSRLLSELVKPPPREARKQARRAGLHVLLISPSDEAFQPAKYTRGSPMGARGVRGCCGDGGEARDAGLRRALGAGSQLGELLAGDGRCGDGLPGRRLGRRRVGDGGDSGEDSRHGHGRRGTCATDEAFTLMASSKAR